MHLAQHKALKGCQQRRQIVDIGLDTEKEDIGDGG